MYKLLNSHSNECHLLYFWIDPNKIEQFIHRKKSVSNWIQRWNVSSPKEPVRTFFDLKKCRVCANEIAFWARLFFLYSFMWFSWIKALGQMHALCNSLVGGWKVVGIDDICNTPDENQFDDIEKKNRLPCDVFDLYTKPYHENTHTQTPYTHTQTPYTHTHKPKHTHSTTTEYTHRLSWHFNPKNALSVTNVQWRQRTTTNTQKTDCC